MRIRVPLPTYLKLAGVTSPPLLIGFVGLALSRNWSQWHLYLMLAAALPLFWVFWLSRFELAVSSGMIEYHCPPFVSRRMEAISVTSIQILSPWTGNRAKLSRATVIVITDSSTREMRLNGKVFSPKELKRALAEIVALSPVLSAQPGIEIDG